MLLTWQLALVKVIQLVTGVAHFIDMPYCATDSKLDFQTSVTSQALVACNRHERNAETALPPTRMQLADMVLGFAGKKRNVDERL